MRGRIGVATVGSLVAMALMLGACSGGDGGDGVATLGEGQEETTGASGSSVDAEDALAEFAECMRENGIEDFADPQVDENGAIVIGGPGGGGSGPPDDVDLEEIQQAMQTCQGLLPQGLGPGEISEEDQAALQDAFLEYAQCMRDNGIDMPDPDFSEGGAFAIGGEGFDPDDPEFQAADEVCRPLLEEVIPGGPGS
jgi:hypothetical protein